MKDHQHGCCVDKACNTETCMQLPNGSTCDDCIWLRSCVALGYTNSGKNTSCDFYPRRFVKAAGRK